MLLGGGSLLLCPAPLGFLVNFTPAWGKKSWASEGTLPTTTGYHWAGRGDVIETEQRTRGIYQVLTLRLP